MPVSCGHAYCLYLPAAEKEKIVVPAYIDPNGRARLFVINSEINPYIASRPELAALAIALPLFGNEAFLTHDSWIACHEVIGGYSEQQIESFANCYRGPIDIETAARVRAAFMQSRLYAEREKRWFSEQWLS